MIQTLDMLGVDFGAFQGRDSAAALFDHDPTRELLRDQFSQNCTEIQANRTFADFYKFTCCPILQMHVTDA